VPRPNILRVEVPQRRFATDQRSTLVQVQDTRSSVRRIISHLCIAIPLSTLPHPPISLSLTNVQDVLLPGLEKTGTRTVL
jgi:hypothetical protein